ncbi:NAD(P)-dependent oxidoreductase [Mycobacterium sp.]|uniref:NAD(P)-dependent oxidoreductase n=1 Tax=Mycobacterium sp. TaxID=1785 RepID=UPI003D0F8B62
MADQFGAIYPPDTDARDTLVAAHAATVRALVTAGAPGDDAGLMDALPHLGAIVSLGDGYELIDVRAAQHRDIGVSNTAPEELRASVADTAVGLALNTVRRFNAAERYVRANHGYDYDSEFMHTRDLTAAAVGILGMGGIGTRIARRLAAFDCDIAYHNRHPIPHCPCRYVHSVVSLARSVDVLVVATAGGPDNRHLVGREELTALGPHGYLINIARGDVIDQDALIDLCSSGGLAGAGLDVFVGEPTLPDALFTLDNVTVTPHIGGGTDRSTAAMHACLIANLRDYLDSGKLDTPVLPPGKRRHAPSS